MHRLSSRARSARSSAVRDLLRLTEQPQVLSLAGGLPSPDVLPVAAIAAATQRVLAVHGPAALQYAPTEGVSGLRAKVSSKLGEPGSVDATIITTGSQQGLDLVARVLVDPGDVVVTETPTYVGALGALHWSSPRLVGVEGDVDGLRTDDLESRLDAGLRPKFVYVVTEFANPTGASMSLERRRHLAALADHYGFLIVEDNPYGDLRFRGTALPPIRTFSDQVVTLGSASKILSPGLRVGWLTAPDWLARSIAIAKQGADLHTSTLSQLLVLELLDDEPWLHDHVHRIVALYGARCESLHRALQVHCGDQIVVNAPAGGMFVWGRLIGDSCRADALLASAIDQGVAFVPGSAFRDDGEDDGTLRLCFTTLNGDELDEAARRLSRAMAVSERSRTPR